MSGGHSCEPLDMVGPTSSHLELAMLPGLSPVLCLLDQPMPPTLALFTSQKVN